MAADTHRASDLIGATVVDSEGEQLGGGLLGEGHRDAAAGVDPVGPEHVVGEGVEDDGRVLRRLLDAVVHRHDDRSC